MTDDSTAEKAWEEYLGNRDPSITDSTTRAHAFMAAWHARDAEVAELVGNGNELVESLREQLAEAQATIEKVREVPHGEFGPWDDDVASWGLITAALDGPLSAPSSTGGNDHE